MKKLFLALFVFGISSAVFAQSKLLRKRMK